LQELGGAIISVRGRTWDVKYRKVCNQPGPNFQRYLEVPKAFCSICYGTLKENRLIRDFSESNCFFVIVWGFRWRFCSREFSGRWQEPRWR
jgi:hypothetical protein